MSVSVPTAPAAAAVIRTAGLTKVYAGHRLPAVDALDLTVHAGRSSGCLAQRRGQDDDCGNAHDAGDPDLGRRATSRASTSSRHPALAKQLIGVVSQQNTLDRQLTVWENLYFHGRLFGIGAAESRAHRRRAAGAVPALQVGEGVRLRALGRDGPAPDGRALDLPPAGGAVHGRADRRPRPPEPPRAVGDPRRAARRRARRSCSRPTTWRRPTSSATASRSWTTARSSRSTRPRAQASRSAPTRS